MTHFFYYFKLNLICYCSRPAKMGESQTQAFLEHPLPPSFCEHPPRAFRWSPLVSCPHGWPLSCSLSGPCQPWRLEALPSLGENFAMDVFSPWGPAASPEGFQGGRTFTPGNTALHPTPDPGGGIRILFGFPSLIALLPSPSSRKDNQ